MSTRRSLVALIGLGLLLAPAVGLAARGGIEISPMFGYTTPGGLELGTTDVEDVKIEGGFTWGGQVGFEARQGVGFEVSYMQQESKLTGKGTIPTIDNLKVGQLHGIFLFERLTHGGESAVKPYLLLGAGATFFNPSGDYDTETKFSWSLGAGFKKEIREGLSLKVQGKYNPTYISDDPGGYWCNPYYCYTVADPDYLDQGEFTAGLSYKLGGR